MNTMLQKFAQRLDVRDDETKKKASELHRLIQLQKFNTVDSAKIVISIDCASKLCATEIDPNDVIKLSGLKKSEYARQKQLFETLLGLTKKLQLNEVCAQLEFNEVIKNDAIKLLTEYAKHKPTDDIDSPRCITMAIYQAWKQRKLKGGHVKQRLIALSKLNPTIWKNYEADWDKWIEQHLPLARNIKKKTAQDQQSDLTDDDTTTNKENVGVREEVEEMEPYEQWRDRMLAIAKAELAKGNTHKSDVK